MTGPDRDSPASSDEAAALQARVAFLADPGSYPGGAEGLRAIETHMSWVFLAGDLAYKLKKPVRLPYLDFSSVEARRLDCEKEVRLNRRLAPDVYLGVVPLTRRKDGRLQLGGEGPAVDWVVKMRRLPEEAMLDRCIARGAVAPERIRPLAAVLARFHAEAPAANWPPGVYAQRLAREAQENAAELSSPLHGLPPARIGAVLAAQTAFLTRRATLLQGRVDSGRVVEGHGDLRPEHICLDPGPVVIDCVEFNRDFRLLDGLDELAFLALECERLGDAALGERLLEAYAAARGDPGDPALVNFYKSHRASLRAKIAAWHLHDPAVTDPAKWRARTGEYLTLAEKYATRC